MRAAPPAYMPRGSRRLRNSRHCRAGSTRSPPPPGTHGGILAQAGCGGSSISGHPRKVVPLHGDIHHGNVLDAGATRMGSHRSEGLDRANAPSISSTSSAIQTPRSRYRWDGSAARSMRGQRRLARPAPASLVDVGVRRTVRFLALGRRRAADSRSRGCRPCRGRAQVLEDWGT